eukprot:CAMPEP_0183478908 /NCGR_PEP_ID=MMETSP0370-20130417/170723_1 /TAXON_ID=268820 /ORGANISM="Peridinium aciculiferum, Strain PAER-2" /LENGTH=77 /DNA_ID=CAMNT_0025671883 /DNA_START=92 /DNA_END=323 /DNA_ORIENTATION=-
MALAEAGKSTAKFWEAVAVIITLTTALILWDVALTAITMTANRPFIDEWVKFDLSNWPELPRSNTGGSAYDSSCEEL